MRAKRWWLAGRGRGRKSANETAGRTDADAVGRIHCSWSVGRKNKCAVSVCCTSQINRDSDPAAQRKQPAVECGRAILFAQADDTDAELAGWLAGASDPSALSSSHSGRTATIIHNTAKGWAGRKHRLDWLSSAPARTGHDRLDRAVRKIQASNANEHASQSSGVASG